MDVEAPSVQERAVEWVVAGLDETVDVATAMELRRVAERLLELADAEQIGSGTARMTVAGAAVYAADRLTDGKAVTQLDVVDAVETVVSTSQSKIATYSQALYNETERELGLTNVNGGLVRAD